MFFVGLFTAAFLLAHPSFAADAEILARLEASIAAQQTNSNHIWTMVAAALVLLMQMGFMLLEAGFVRSKNSVNVAHKNFVDLIVSITCFYAVGFGIMFGASLGGWFGSPSDLSFFSDVDPWIYTFFVFQAVFVGTAATIVSGSVAERMRFSGYIIASFVIAVVIYPVFGHWAWGNLLIGDNQAWLADRGFIDFAGSTVVHSVGAWVGLAGIIILGPRLGKFNKDGSSNQIQGYSAVLAGAGALVLFVGWFGFNGGSTTAGTPEFAKIIANTAIAAVFGGASSFVLGYCVHKVFHPSHSINGLLGGLVAITAGCDALLPGGAAVVGIIAGLLVVASSEFLERGCKLDDVLCAVSIHGTCGAFGTIAVAFFATEDKLAAGSRFDQFLIQAEGVGLAFIWAFTLGYATFYLIDKTIGLRVSEDEEIQGLNAAEHGVTLGTGEIQRTLLEMMRNDEIDLTRTLDENTGDEAAEIAQIVNPFLHRVRALVGEIQSCAGEIGKRSNGLETLSQSFITGADAVLHEAQGTAASLKDVDTQLQAKTDTFEKMSQNSVEIANSAQSMSMQLTDVSRTVEEMATAVEAVAKNANHAGSVSNDVLRLTTDAKQTSASLQEAASQIQDIVGLISDIAGKTNMLALNATIEAARAGEYGRGLSVVAEEVKSLSNSTTKALEEIEKRVSSLLDGSGTVAMSVDEVADIVMTMNEAIKTIVTTTTEQNSATHEIAGYVVSVSDSAQSITERIETLANDITNGSSQVEAISRYTNGIRQGSKKLRAEADSGLINAQDVDGHVEYLNSIAGNLKKTVNIFKV